jgi:hypothetical protein
MRGLVAHTNPPKIVSFFEFSRPGFACDAARLGWVVGDSVNGWNKPLIFRGDFVNI